MSTSDASTELAISRGGDTRRAYLRVSPELEPYLVVARPSASAPAPAHGERLAPSAWQLALTAAGMVAVVNSVVVAACAGLALEAAGVRSPAIPVAVGAVIGAAAFTLQERHHRRARDNNSPRAVDRAAILISPPQPALWPERRIPMSPISRGFQGRRPQVDISRVPPGQHVVDDFPVLSAGSTPHRPPNQWTFQIRGAVDQPVSWTWDELLALPAETPTVDIHCVTAWSKLDTTWTGVSIDTLFAGLETEAEYVSAWCDDGYRTNLPLEDVTGGRAWIAYGFGGEPLDPEHGGPARLLVPHLYFWKSAKWVRGLELLVEDRPGFWEAAGYHNYGDPWKEQRYEGD